MIKHTRAYKKTILIASSAMDIATWQPVSKDLIHRGYDVFTYEADKVASGEVPLHIHITNASGMVVDYGGTQLSLNEIAAAWYRRPTQFLEDNIDKAEQIRVDSERSTLQYTLWDTVPEHAWLNSPKNISHAEHKLGQLQIAREVGFKIPTTTVTNDWRSIGSSLPKDIIYKPAQGVLHRDNKLMLVFTTPLTNRPSALPITSNPFPGIWQPSLTKAREWRVTVVGDQVFPVAIYTNEGAKDDWRKHQTDPEKVRFEHEDFPDVLKDQCLKYLEKFGLNFGAFDFIEDDSGVITFLECNPNGQFGWLETKLALPISQAIADLLVQKAEENALR